MTLPQTGQRPATTGNAAALPDGGSRRPPFPTDAGTIGGKAAQLVRLAAAGFAVPPFLVVPSAALGAGDLDAATRARIMPSALRQAGLGDGPFAVRSSAAAEDGASASHAGQFESRLDVAGSALEEAILAVHRSGARSHVAVYRSLRDAAAAERPDRCGDPGGAPGEQPPSTATEAGPSVIVQRMVAARAAGVLFTADPLTGDRGTMPVSAVEGLADRLVGGEADGTSYRLPRSGPLTAAVDAGGPLTAGDLAALRDLALRVEAELGAPQDIEWAFDAERLWLLQSRPITTLTAAIPDPRRLVLDNANIIESYPGLVSPLTFSFAVMVYAEVYRRFLALLGVPAATIAHHRAMLDNMLVRYRGRVYYNLVEWYRALALLPGFRLNRAHMETMMGVGEPLPAAIADSLAPPPAHGVARVGEWLRLARSSLSLAVQALLLPRTIRRFQARLDAALATPAGALQAMPLSALVAHYRAIEAELLTRWDAPLVNDFLCMIAFGASRKMMERWAGADGIALHNDVMIGQGDIVSAEPAQRIRRMGAAIADAPELIAALERGERKVASDPRLAAAMTAYLERFGDRCTEELKLESIPLADDPAPLLRAIAAAARSRPFLAARPDDPAERLAALFPGRPLRRRAAAAILGYAKRRVRDRENLRFERTRVFGRARRIFLAIGRELHGLGRLDDPREIFMLTVGEILGAVEGAATSTDLRGLARLRAAEQAHAARLPDPPERIELAGSLVADEWASPTPGDAAAGARPEAAAGDATRTGTGCSAGRVEGVARVIDDPARQAIAPGEIMVARHTDPGWIALFANAAAIVVERGSLLSHSAIVARELGIPCVVALKGAMDWIHDGERIAVDGATGTVTRLAADRP